MDDSLSIGLTYFVNVAMMIISVYLLFLFFKDSTFRPCLLYQNIILSIVILIDNAFRLIIPESKGPLCSTQAFILVFLDKFLLFTITIYIVLLYIGTIHKQYYDTNEKKIFYISLIINIAISLIATILIISIYDIAKWDDDKHKTYCYGSDTIVITEEPYEIDKNARDIKHIVDSSFSLALIVINLFCLIKLLIFVGEQIKQQKLGLINTDINIKGFYDKLLWLFFINGFTLIESILIINDKLFVPDKYIDFTYLLTYLIVDLIYSLNDTVIKITTKIFCSTYFIRKFTPGIKGGDALGDDEDYDDSRRNSTASDMSD